MLKNLSLSLHLLKKFSHEKKSWGVRELAKELGVNHTVIFRILETMRENDFLVQNPETKKYSLGVVFLELGTITKAGLGLDELIRPVLAELCQVLSESVFLTTIDGDECITLMVVEPPNRVKVSAFEGSRSPLYAGASYRSILAFQPDEFIEEILHKGIIQFTSNTLTEPEAYWKEIRKIRTEGYAISCGEYTPDVIAIAVPLLDPSRRVTASITVSCPAYRFSEELKSRMVEQLFQKKAVLEEVLSKFGIYFS